MNDFETATDAQETVKERIEKYENCHGKIDQAIAHGTEDVMIYLKMGEKLIPDYLPAGIRVRSVESDGGIIIEKP